MIFRCHFYYLFYIFTEITIYWEFIDIIQIESGEGNPTIKVLEKVLLTPGETIGLLQLMILSTHYCIFQMGISSR